MRNLEMIKDEIEEIVYENGMEFFDDYEKIEINEERVEVYKVKDVYCVLFFDYGDSLCEMDVVENFDDIKDCIDDG
jgi:hypothetical protein